MFFILAPEKCITRSKNGSLVWKMDLSLEKWLIREKNGEGVKKKIC
jgi:hypothetical protein